METSTIVVQDGHGFEEGEDIYIDTLDMRWWRRLVNFILRKGHPMKRERFTIAEVCGPNELIISNGICPQ